MKLTRDFLYFTIKFRSWKEWTIVLSFILFMGMLIFCYFKEPGINWLEIIIIPTVISFLMGVFVSLWFTVMAERDQFELNLEMELDKLHQNLLFTLEKATEIVRDPYYSNEEKVRRLVFYLTKPADTYFIEKEYNDLFLQYHIVLEKDFEFIKKLNCTCSSTEFVVQFNQKIDERTEEHFRFDAKVLKYRQEIFQKRRSNKNWILKNKRIQKQVVDSESLFKLLIQKSVEVFVTM